MLDLEDGVGQRDKAARRRAIAALLARPLPPKARVLIRCNGQDATEEMLLDLEATCCAALAGFVMPMASSPADVRSFALLLDDHEARLGLPRGHFTIHLLVEQPAAFLALKQMTTASERIASVMFGKEDFMACFPTASERAADLAEAQLPLHAAALGLPAIASPFCAIDDPRGFERYCRRVRALGYAGALTLHPSQRAVADRAFAASPKELHAARRMVASDSDPQVCQQQGRIVGPPMRKRARALLEAAGPSADPAQQARTGRSGRLPRYGLALEHAQIGAVLDGPHVHTVDEALRTKWASHFPLDDAVFTAAPAARAHGFDELPPSLLLNLCLCLSVEPFSHSCRLHLGLRDARQIAPVVIGHTVRVQIRIEQLCNTSSGDAAVIVTTHLLVNQRDEPVFVLTKDSYYDPIPGLEARAALPQHGALHERFAAALAAPALQLAEAQHPGRSDAYVPPSLPVEAGEVLLHPAVRPIGWSENLELTTLVRNTHPVHFDAQRYGRDGIVVCGGFVQALVQGLAAAELRQVVEERLLHSFHVQTVKPGDRIGAISRVLDVRDTGDGFEEVTVSTLGLVNVDVARELAGVPIPDVLFDPAPMKPAELRARCATCCPELHGHVALRVIRVVRRIRTR